MFQYLLKTVFVKSQVLNKLIRWPWDYIMCGEACCSQWVVGENQLRKD